MTAPDPTPVTAELDAAAASFAGYAAAVAVALDAAAAQTAAASASIVDLRTQLAVCAERPLFGATASRLQLPGGGVETYPQATARVVADLGPQMLRIYDDGKGAAQAVANAAATGLLGTVPMILSFKLPPADVAAGLHDTDIAAAVARLPTSVDTYLVFDHEADHHSQLGEYTPAQFIAGFERFRSIVWGQPNQRVRSTVILTGYDLATRLPQFWPVGYFADAFGIDPYCHAAGVTAAGFLGPLLTQARALTHSPDLPLLVAELGYDAPTGVEAFVASLGDVYGLRGVCWFQSGTYAITDAAAAAYKALTVAGVS